MYEHGCGSQIIYTGVHCVAMWKDYGVQRKNSEKSCQKFRFVPDREGLNVGQEVGIWSMYCRHRWLLDQGQDILIILCTEKLSLEFYITDYKKAF